MKKVIGGCFGLGCLVWIGIFAFGFISALLEDVKDSPGKKEFEAANTQITVYSKEIGFGNTDVAQQMAQAYSQQLSKDMSLLFKLGSNFNPSTMNNCLTYCRVDDNSVVFLCQVPDLRGFKDDVMAVLAKMAWATAMDVVSQKLPGKTVKMAVGLRGFAVYGAVLEGPSNADPVKTTLEDPSSKSLLYPYFQNADEPSKASR